MTFAPLRWGICSAGKICNDFSACLAALPDNEHVIRAVASSSLERSKAFALKFDIPSAYGSYTELASDPTVDVVYIGSLNSQHVQHVKLMLGSRKHVLCEKPMCLTVKETEEVIALAKEKDLFLMEAVWSRYFPVYDRMQKAIADGEIGEVNHVQATFGINVGHVERVQNKALGGGSVYDVGIYVIQLAQYVFKEYPSEVVGTGFLNAYGVDDMVAITMKYSNSKLASLSCSSRTCAPNDAQISGTKGNIRIHSLFWCPTKVTVNEKTYEFPLPPAPPRFNYDNGAGMTYEAQEVRRCLLAGKRESPRIRHSDSLELAKIIKKIRNDVGYKVDLDD